VCRSAGLTLKPLGSSPYEKDKSLDHLYLRNTLITSKNNLIDSRSKLRGIKSSFFDMSDDLFYRISLIGFLVVFSSMVFFLTKYREKKVNNISQISITEQI